MTLEIVVERPFITTILNEGILHGKTSIAISSPFLGLDLVGLDLSGSGKISFLAGENDFTRAYYQVQTKLGDPLDKEVPSFSDYREALHASLLLPPDNMPDLMREISTMEKRRNEPSRYPRQPCLALDTNLAYKRLFSRLGLSGDTCGAKGFDPNRIQILVPNLVEKEISDRVRRKYDAQELSILKRAFGSPQLLDEMSNCLHKDGRRAMNALAELTAIRSKYSVWDVQGGEWSQDKEARDAEILGALAKHAREENIDVLFVSTDDKASASAITAKVPILVLRYPNAIPISVPFDPWLVPELIFELAIAFGAISLKGLGVRIMGDWAGKMVDDFKAEKIKVVGEGNSPLSQALDKDARILARLRKEIDLSGVR
jgi:hypothetical protein